MKKVSYKEILVKLYENTDMQNMNISEMLLVRKIKKYDKEINGIYSVKLDRKVMTVTGQILEIPKNAFNIDYILDGDQTENNPYFTNSENEHMIMINVTEATDNEIYYKIWSDISFSLATRKIDFIISEGKIQLDPVYEGRTVTVFYSCYSLNEKGEFLVSENHEDAIINSIKHFIYNKELFKKKMLSKRLYNDDYNFLRQLRSDMNLSIRNARVKDLHENKTSLDKNIINVYNVLVENDIY